MAIGGITNTGVLVLMRRDRLVRMVCPKSSGSMWCGDHCPLFGYERSVDGKVFSLRLCDRVLYVRDWKRDIEPVEEDWKKVEGEEDTEGE